MSENGDKPRVVTLPNGERRIHLPRGGEVQVLTTDEVLSLYATLAKLLKESELLGGEKREEPKPVPERPARSNDFILSEIAAGRERELEVATEQALTALREAVEGYVDAVADLPDEGGVVSGDYTENEENDVFEKALACFYGTRMKEFWAWHNHKIMRAER